MGYETGPRTTAATPGNDTGPEVAPGKTTRTQGIRTGVAVVDDGTLCERDPSYSCYLTPDQRTRFLAVIGDRAGIVADNARAALADAAVDELLRDETTWGPLAEFLFYSATGWMIGGILRQVSRNMRPELYTKYEPHISATLTNASRGFRKTLQGNARTAGNHAKASKVRFLQLVRDGIPLWQDAIVTGTETKNLDDDGLVGLKDGLDPAVNTSGEFRGRLDDMLARFDKDQIDQVGVEAIYRHGELQWIGRGKKRRLVMLEDHGLHHIAASGDDTKPRDLVAKEGQDGKPIVIDHDLESMALAMYRERTGREPVEMDIERGMTVAAQIGGSVAGGILDSLLAGTP